MRDHLSLEVPRAERTDVAHPISAASVHGTAALGLEDASAAGQGADHRSERQQTVVAAEAGREKARDRTVQEQRILTPELVLEQARTRRT
jgi:hypothetical protein